MFFCKIVKNPAKITILTAPLDWGLGHATRCIPIIKELNQAGHKVIIAAEGPLRTLLELEFPNNLFVPLLGYKVKYSKRGSWLFFSLLLQVPKILIIVFKEHRWLKNAVRTYAVDLIISDNRFGLFHKTTPSIYITHQLLIKTGNRLSEILCQRVHYWIIKKFTECWVPDFEEAGGIAGELSHPKKKLSHTRYIGCLSRFESEGLPNKVYQLLILVSGPEPQRTIFEKLLLDQLGNFSGAVLFVRGLPAGSGEAAVKTNRGLNNKIVFEDHLSAAELSRRIQQSEMVICRSGYTSLMDLVKLKQKAILIPTPGQSEQEYLAFYLRSKNIFYVAQQDGFNLESALTNAAAFPYRMPDNNMYLYRQAIHEFFTTGKEGSNYCK